MDLLNYTYKDLDFHVQVKVDKYRVCFKIFDIAGEQEDGVLVYVKQGSTSSTDVTISTENAEVFAHGHVKWDGCSNWHFDTQDDCMIHGCSKSDIERIGLILGRCWDLAAELLPTWDKEIADGI